MNEFSPPHNWDTQYRNMYPDIPVLEMFTQPNGVRNKCSPSLAKGIA